MLYSFPIVSFASDTYQKRVMNAFKIPLIYHFVFWTLYFTFNWLRWGSLYNDYIYSLKTNLIEFPIHIIGAYFNILVLIPRMIPKKIGQYILVFLSSLLVLALIKIGVTYSLITTKIYIEAGVEDGLAVTINYIITAFIGEFYVVGTASAIPIMINWVRARTKTKELEKIYLETELDFLKSQIQPHFFFNTLNNLYSLTLDKSDKAPETVLKLSELMSYVIYDANQKLVPVVNEVKHIQNYLDLEKLRYGDRLNVELSISGDIDDKKIPPVMLLPFIENSFKHGVKIDDSIIPIWITINAQEGYLYFSTENKKPAYFEENGLENHKHGIGLQNTLRRLKLVFGENYQFEIDDGGENYKITLKIPLE